MVHGQRRSEVALLAADDDHVGGRRNGIGDAVFPVQTDLDGKTGGIGMIAVDARRGDEGRIGNFGGVVGGSGSFVAAQERFTGDVADAGIDGDAEGALFAQALDGLQVGEAHEDAVAGLQVAELQGEEVLALGFGQGGAVAGGFGFLVEFAGGGGFFDFGEDHAAVDVHLAAVGCGVGGQREEEAAIEGVFVRLLEELVDLDGGEAGGDFGVDRDGAERKENAGGFEPAFEAEGFVGVFVETVVHLVTGVFFCRMRLMAATWAAVGRAPSRPIKAKEPSSGTTFQVSAENGGMVATGLCSRRARVRSSRRLVLSRP